MSEDPTQPVKLKSYSIKPKKTKDPDPGSYNVDESIRKTQWPSRIFLFSKTKSNNYVGKLCPLLSDIFIFLDEYVKAKTFVPAVGKYKEVEKGVNKLSKPIPQLRRLR